MQSLWMLLAAFLFAVMGACVKLAASRYSVMEIVLYRSLLGAIGIAAFVRWRGETLTTVVPWMHLRRGAVGTAALSLWFYATTILPLGTSMTLNYSSALFLAAYIVAVALLAGRRVDWPLAATVLLGFAGVVLALRPSFAQEQTVGALAGLASGVLSTFAYWHVRELGRLGEPEWRTVFYFSVSGCVLGLLGTLLSGFSAHDPLGVALLLAVGLTATFAQLAMTRAYGQGRLLLTASLQYSAIVFASVFGVTLFGDRLPLSAWLGIALIVGSGVLATALTARAKRAAQLPRTLETAAEQ
jgi:drug/metabolite transporter (DMT)-like permease